VGEMKSKDVWERQLQRNKSQGMMSRAKELSWEPIRKGAIYCAPACGGSCTWAAHQRAVKDASALAKELGVGWHSRVWENLGWHHEAKFNSGSNMEFTVHRYSPKHRYWASLRDGGQFTADANTPKEAVALVVDKVAGQAQALLVIAAQASSAWHRTVGESSK
jgi:hypothetical protein